MTPVAPLLPEPWTWTEQEGDARLRREVDDQGWSFFHAPDMDGGDPVALARRLFGWRPLRIRQKLITPAPVQKPGAGYWETTGEALLHTDYPPSGGLPPSAIVMICRSPASDGGDTLLLDAWATLRAIEAADASLFDRLFRTPRRFRFAEHDNWGATFSLRRGHFIGLHAAHDHEDDPVARELRPFLDRTPTVRLAPRAGDVFVANNHRCLHGRLPFEDRGRQFLRFMLWFAEPFAAPPAWVDRAAHRGERLAADLAGEPLWLRQRFGVDVPAVSAAALERLRAVLELIADPALAGAPPPRQDREVTRPPGLEHRRHEDLDTLLSLGLAGLEEEGPPSKDREEHAQAVLEGLRRGARR